MLKAFINAIILIEFKKCIMKGRVEYDTSATGITCNKQSAR